MKYVVSIPFSGYFRGYDVAVVEADSEEAARDKARNYEFLSLERERETVRDDTEYDWSEMVVESVA